MYKRQPQDWEAIHVRVSEIEADTGSVFRRPALEVLLPVLQVAEALAQKYDAVSYTHLDVYKRQFVCNYFCGIPH